MFLKLPSIATLFLFLLSISAINLENSASQLGDDEDNEVVLAGQSPPCKVVIVGGGVGGLYAAYRLTPTYKSGVCVFESTDEVGGRTKDVEGIDNRLYGTGALRIFGRQLLVLKLAKELGIKTEVTNYRANIVKARGKVLPVYTTFTENGNKYVDVITEVCKNVYIGLEAAHKCEIDAAENNPADTPFQELINAFQADPKITDKYANFPDFARSMIGDERFEFTRDMYRFRSDFFSTAARSYMEYLTQEWQLYGPQHYPIGGMSQFARRMAQKIQALGGRIFLNESVKTINENGPKNFDIITTKRTLTNRNKLIIAVPPEGLKTVGGNIMTEIKKDLRYQAIYGVPVSTVQAWWPSAWWEQIRAQVPDNDPVSRVWTRTQCFNFMEIPRNPYAANQKVTRAVYDDGTCVETWRLLMKKGNAAVKEEIMQGLKTVFPDINIPQPLKIHPTYHPVAWHFQHGWSNFTNREIVEFARTPIQGRRLVMVGEAYNPDRSGWIDAAIKSAMQGLQAHFAIPFGCQCDFVGAPYCPASCPQAVDPIVDPLT